MELKVDLRAFGLKPENISPPINAFPRKVQYNEFDYQMSEDGGPRLSWKPQIYDVFAVSGCFSAISIFRSRPVRLSRLRVQMEAAKPVS